MVQWLRVRRPMQGSQVRSLVREDPTCCEQLSLSTTATEPERPRTRAPPQEEPPRTLQRQGGPRLPNSREPVRSNKDPVQSE